MVAYLLCLREVIRFVRTKGTTDTISKAKMTPVNQKAAEEQSSLADLAEQRVPIDSNNSSAAQRLDLKKKIVRSLRSLLIKNQIDATRAQLF